MKKNLLEVIAIALLIAENAPQTIEIRSAIKSLKQAEGSISQIIEELVENYGTSPEPGTKTLIQGSEETAVSIVDVNGVPTVEEFVATKK